MTNEQGSDQPTSESNAQSSPESPVGPSTPRQDEMGSNADSRSQDEEKETIKLEKEIRSGERWLIGISGASVVINIVIALIYYGQLRQMRIATQKAGIGADAAKRSVDLAMESTHLEQRAWIAERLGNSTVTDKEPISIPMQIANTGKTPAKTIQAYIVVTVLKRNQDPSFDYTSKTVPRYFVEIGTLFPNSSQTLPLKAGQRKFGKNKIMIATEPMRKQIISGDLYISIYGRLTYDDIFGVSHWMTFCKFSSGHLNIAIPQTYKKCADYNDTDNNR